MRYILYILLFLPFITITPARAGGDKIWAVADQEFLSEKDLIQRMRHSKNILIGIRTDNPEHHKNAATLINNLVKKGQKSVVLLSHVERNKQNAFAIFLQRHKKSKKEYDATGLDMLLDWSNNGQPDWRIVRPVFDVAMIKKLALKAINYSRYEIGELHRGKLPIDIEEALLPLLEIEIDITKKLRASHCDLLPPEILEKFSLVHRARNSLFALNIAETKSDKTIFIASHEHVIKDTGVSRYLRKLKVADKNITLLFVESQQGIRNSQADYVWYTDKIFRPPSCQIHLTN